MKPSHHPARRLVGLACGLLVAGITLGRCLVGCTAAQGKAAEQILTQLGCDLVAVLSGSEEVGKLCPDIAAEVEAEIAKAVAARRDVKPDNLLGHRAHRRRVKLTDHAPERDAGESIEEGPPLEAALRVLARRRLDAGADR